MALPPSAAAMIAIGYTVAEVGPDAFTISGIQAPPENLTGAEFEAFADSILNERTLRDRADQAIANLEQAWTNWATLTAAQKDAALRLNVRATVALARLILRKLDQT